jgi:hypothetical protein
VILAISGSRNRFGRASTSTLALSLPRKPKVSCSTRLFQQQTVLSSFVSHSAQPAVVACPCRPPFDCLSPPSILSTTLLHVAACTCSRSDTIRTRQVAASSERRHRRGSGSERTVLYPAKVTGTSFLVPRGIRDPTDLHDSLTGESFTRPKSLTTVLFLGQRLTHAQSGFPCSSTTPTHDELPTRPASAWGDICPWRIR